MLTDVTYSLMPLAHKSLADLIQLLRPQGKVQWQKSWSAWETWCKYQNSEDSPSHGAFHDLWILLSDDICFRNKSLYLVSDSNINCSCSIVSCRFLNCFHTYYHVFFIMGVFLRQCSKGFSSISSIKWNKYIWIKKTK